MQPAGGRARINEYRVRLRVDVGSTCSGSGGMGDGEVAAR